MAEDERLAIAAEAIRRAELRATSGQLALEVIHEIKDPLEALGHLTYLALEEPDQPEKVREYRHLAQEQMRLLDEIASETLVLRERSFTRDLLRAFIRDLGRYEQQWHMFWAKGRPAPN